MPMSPQEAIDLLHKWMLENRVIHVSLSDGNDMLVKLLGRIDSIPGDILHLSLTKSTYSLGPYTFLDLPLSTCEFEYSDAEHTPEPLRSQIKGHDALLYIYRPGFVLGFAVLPPIREWAKL